MKIFLKMSVQGAETQSRTAQTEELVLHTIGDSHLSRWSELQYEYRKGKYNGKPADALLNSVWRYTASML